MKESDSVGARIAKYRKMRGLSQHQLVARTGASYSMISKVESGHATPSAAMVGLIAQALRIDPSRLYSEEEHEQTLDILPIIRRTLAAVDLMDDDLEPEPLDQLRPLVTQVAKWRRGAQYRKVAEVLPDLVDRLLVTAREEGEPAYAMLTDTYRAANSLSHKLGYNDLSMTATERMEWAATKSGDPLRLASAHFVKASTLARIGATRQAMRLLTRSMADIEPMIGSDPIAMAVYSTLHMKAGAIAATVTDADTSRMHFAEAARLAEQFPEGVVYDTVAGATNVRFYRVGAEVDLGDAGRAVEIAKDTRLPTTKSAVGAERQTYFWLDTARAHLLAGNPDAAIEALLESRAVAPEHFRSNPTVKAAVRAVADQQHRTSDALRSLADSAGVAD
ncbi:hypothetical protein JMUB6875_66880 [Nocardia sp. JMUB6875]|uniref:helix-turn-helix domain-containing protein n=1 Tax=Nocardia sp. JMUB6875 TaxID=3158170 RepID=UPI0032E7D5EB